ncbi:hypothetical protein BD410DRAFT_807647 [Rickenella mellea]|uniref:Uncharacterized protein n=1 Tax=Rickenella mellea TaxID=50990 RepID=A0A4Y7PPK6_9AGAM|nr:hypothetical protein BD410DRAFT_807647 [Rickenella mellea]
MGVTKRMKANHRFLAKEPPLCLNSDEHLSPENRPCDQQALCSYPNDIDPHICKHSKLKSPQNATAVIYACVDEGLGAVDNRVRSQRKEWMLRSSGLHLQDEVNPEAGKESRSSVPPKIAGSFDLGRVQVMIAMDPSRKIRPPDRKKNIGTLRSAIEPAHKPDDKCEEADKDEPKPVAKRPPGGDWDPPETWHVDRLVVVHFESEPQVPNRLESLKAGLNECQSSTIAVHVWPDIPAPRRRITSRRSIAVGRWAERLATKAAEESLEVTWEFPNRVFRFLRRFLLEVYSSTELEAFAEPFHVRRSVEGSKDSSHATVAE